MEKDTHITDVIFRKFKDGQQEVIAIMPHEVCDITGSVTSYMHIGQHGACDYNEVLKATKLATPTESLALYTELEKLGYNLLVIRKQNRTKFLNSYRNGNKN
jgi:hypothetical protein